MASVSRTIALWGAVMTLGLVQVCSAEPLDFKIAAEFVTSPGPLPELPALPTFWPISIPAAEPAEGTTIAPHERAELSADARAIVAGNNQFAIDLYRRLATDSGSDQNLLASPLSISSALAMTYAGARGRTAQEMAEVLRFPLPDDRLHPAFGELTRDLDAAREGYELRIANRLFGQQDFAFRQPFLDLTGEHYNAPLESLDFVKNPDGSRERINHWVESKTNGKIRNLLPEGSIRDTTRLVLTNAIYFDGKWKYKFDEDDTREELFYAADGTASQVEMMFQKERFRYGKFDGFQLLEMPYAGDDLSMVVMLPDAMDGLSALEASLTPDLVENSLAAMRERDVLVHLPKFKFEATFGLSKTLQDMGMVDAFRNADFSGIGGGDLAISNVLHKAFIDVNEDGTEAAAATAVVIGTTSICFDCSPPPPPVFRADHPFLFALRDMHSGSLMFLGRVTQPGESVIGQLASVPEPGSAILLACGLALVSKRRRRIGDRIYVVTGGSPVGDADISSSR